MKCANLGPSSHSRSVKWDYADNLIPVQVPNLEEEVLRLLPGLNKKFHGIAVFVPTPEVSMFDLTLQESLLETEYIYKILLSVAITDLGSLICKNIILSKFWSFGNFQHFHGIFSKIKIQGLKNDQNYRF